MIPVVPNAELTLDDHRHARRGPMIVRETVGDGRLAVNLGQARELLAGEPARPPGRFASLERVDTFICQCPVPAGSCGPADGKFAGYFGLGEAVQQILGCLQTSPFHLLTIQGDLRVYVHLEAR